MNSELWLISLEYDAHRNEGVLKSLVETDKGSRRVSELGIGMNRGIDRLTYNMLFDEKMGDTIHIALGEALEECVPDDREFNESAQHVDMLVDMRAHVSKWMAKLFSEMGRSGLKTDSMYNVTMSAFDPN